MLETIRKTYRELERGEPGRRFIAFHNRSRGADGGLVWRRVGGILLGLVLVFVGVAISLPPGIPGFLLYLPGLALVAARLRFVASGLDRMECAVRRLHRWAREVQRG